MAFFLDVAELRKHLHGWLQADMLEHLDIPLHIDNESYNKGLVAGYYTSQAANTQEYNIREERMLNTV